MYLLAQNGSSEAIVAIGSIIVGGGMLASFITIVQYLTRSFLGAMKTQSDSFTGEMRARDQLIKQMSDENKEQRIASRDGMAKVVTAMTENTISNHRVSESVANLSRYIEQNCMRKQAS